MTSVLPAIVLALVGLSLIGFIIWVVFGSLILDLRAWAGRQKLVRKQRLLSEADELLRKGDLTLALPKLKDALLLDQELNTPILIETVTHHHLSILSRLISIAEQSSTHLPNLAIVEDLLASRAQLFRTLSEARQTRRSLRRRSAGKETEVPDWARAEYEKKLTEIRDRLATNKKSLDAKLGEIFLALSSRSSAQEVTYH